MVHISVIDHLLYPVVRLDLHLTVNLFYRSNKYQTCHLKTFDTEGLMINNNNNNNMYDETAAVTTSGSINSVLINFGLL